MLCCAAGTRYASGAVLRVLRSYPGSWEVHVLAADGASQVNPRAGIHLPSHAWALFGIEYRAHKGCTLSSCLDSKLHKQPGIAVCQERISCDSLGPFLLKEVKDSQQKP